MFQGEPDCDFTVLCFRVNRTVILCKTSRWDTMFNALGKVRRRRGRRAVSTDTLLQASVNLSIDSAQLSVNDSVFFTYREDPVITSVSPKASILRYVITQYYDPHSQYYHPHSHPHPQIIISPKASILRYVITTPTPTPRIIPNTQSHQLLT